MVKQYNYFKLFAIFIILFCLSCAPLRPPVSPVSPEQKKGIYHEVKEGETIWSIAESYQVSAEDIVRANDYCKIKELRPGSLIFIPGATKSIAPKLPSEPPSEKIPKISYEVDFIFPVKGKIISHFGLRNGRQHQGVDIKAPLGTEIKAVSKGTVVYSSDKMRGYGKIIIIKHENDFHSVYAHNRENLVKEGQTVAKGQVVAFVGNIGETTCPHLHFEIRYKGECLNPLLFFSKRELELVESENQETSINKYR